MDIWNVCVCVYIYIFVCVCNNNGSSTTAIRHVTKHPRVLDTVVLIIFHHASRIGKLIRHLQMWIKITEYLGL